MEKAEYAEYVKEADPDGVFTSRRFDQFSDKDHEDYITLYGPEKYLQRRKLDARLAYKEKLEQEIQEAEKKTGQGVVTRAEFEELQQKVQEGKVPHSRLQEMIDRGKEFGWTD